MKNLIEYLEQKIEETNQFIGDDYNKLSDETDSNEDMMRSYDLGRLDTLQQIKRLLNNRTK